MIKIKIVLTATEFFSTSFQKRYFTIFRPDRDLTEIVTNQFVNAPLGAASSARLGRVS